VQKPVVNKVLSLALLGVVIEHTTFEFVIYVIYIFSFLDSESPAAVIVAALIPSLVAVIAITLFGVVLCSYIRLQMNQDERQNSVEARDYPECAVVIQNLASVETKETVAYETGIQAIATESNIAYQAGIYAGPQSRAAQYFCLS